MHGHSRTSRSHVQATAHTHVRTASNQPAGRTATTPTRQPPSRTSLMALSFRQPLTQSTTSPPRASLTAGSDCFSLQAFIAHTYRKLCQARSLTCMTATPSQCLRTHESLMVFLQWHGTTVAKFEAMSRSRIKPQTSPNSFLSAPSSRRACAMVTLLRRHSRMRKSDAWLRQQQRQASRSPKTFASFSGEVRSSSFCVAKLNLCGPCAISSPLLCPSHLLQCVRRPW